MVELNNVNELIKLASNSNYPLAWILPIILVVFLVWRKFTTTEYVTAGKAAFESLNQLCDQLQEENKNLIADLKNSQDQLSQSSDTIKTLRNDIVKIKRKK